MSTKEQSTSREKVNLPVPNSNLDNSLALPEHWRHEIQSRLAAGETLVGWFLPDLDSGLEFALGLVVLTNDRIITYELSGLDGTDPAPNTDVVAASLRQEWRLVDVADVLLVQRTGYGVAQLQGRERLLASFYFTAAKLPNAAKFVDQIRRCLNGRQTLDHADGIRASCPSCGVLLNSEDSDCQNCRPAQASAPVRSLSRLNRFARPRARWLVLGIALTLATTATSLVPPYITMPLMDRVLVPYQAGQQVNFGLVPWYLSLLFGSAMLAWLLGWAKTFVVARFGELLSADIRNETFEHLQRLSLDFFGTKRTGDLISRISNDTERICNFVSINVADFSSDAVLIVMTAGTLLTINPAMALVTLLPFPFIAWMIQSVRIRLRHGFARGCASWAEMVNVLADTIPGIRVVKAFAQERREVGRFRRRNQHVFDANNRVNRLWALFGPTVTFLTDCGLLVIWAFGAWSVVQHHVTVGVLTAFIAFIGRLYTRLDSMSRMLASTQRAAAATHRIFEVLDCAPTVREPAHPVHPGRLSGEIELRDVSFGYGPRRVLHGLNLTVKRGEMIGLVGPSGAGKSTIINLICRFYDVTSGAVIVDGTDIRSFPLEEYRQNIGIVLQEPYLFYGTIAENIAYGRPDASRAEIVAAARAGRAHDFILKLPDGYDSLVGERGQSLSGGERQRISIARALLTDPRILILDEATSSVDSETEREIQAALDNLVHGRTTIAIAHRLSTLRRANRLVVVDDGKITHIGLHADLMAQSAVYRRLQEAPQQMVPVATGACQP